MMSDHSRVNELSRPIKPPHFWQGLLWKELRQLQPLVIMLVCLTAVLAIAYLLIGEHAVHAVPAQMIPLTMPVLFAAGAGAILVSNEKETKSLRWFATLPIDPRKVYFGKLTAALLGLLGMWIVCWLLSLVMGAWSSRQPPSPYYLSALIRFSASFWVLHTVFVLVCGLYTAWRWEGAFASLVLMLVIATLPFIIADAGASIWTSLTQEFVSPEMVSEIASLVTLSGILLFVGLGRLATMRYLQPQEANLGPLPAVVGHVSKTKQSHLTTRPYRYSISSLLWQSIHHDRRVLLGLLTAIALGTLCLPILWSNVHSFGSFTPRPLAIFVVFAGLVAVSWLGVFAFTGDGSATRLRFLADRGTSPRLVWLGRHLVAVAVLSTGLVFLAGIQVWGLRPRMWHYYGSETIPAFSIATMALLLAIIYGVSQWTSQVIRLLAGTAFLAPLLSACMVAWLVTAAIAMGCSPWMVLLCIAIPFLATAATMGRHMEGRRDMMFWAVHGIAAVGCVLLPTANMAWDIFSFPSMSSARFQEVHTMAESVQRSPQSGFNVLAVKSGESRKSETQLETTNDDELMHRIAVDGKGPQAWMDIQGPPDSPLHSEWPLFQRAIGSTEYYRLKLISDPSDEHQKLFAQWSNTLVEIARRLRLSDRLIDQQAVDEIEIYLTQAYAKPDMAAWADQAFTTTAIELVSNRKGRREARRRALLLSWAKVIQGGENGEPVVFDGFRDYLWSFNIAPFQHQWIYPRSVNAMTDQMLRMIEADEAGESTEPMRRKLHGMFFGSDEFYEIGPYAPRMQPSTEPTASIAGHTLRTFPALAWFAPWEAEAEKLAETR